MTERLPLLDRLRGFAILGILIANLPWYSQPISSHSSPLRATLEPADLAVDALGLIFVDSKMVTLLSVLFGAGLAVQAERARLERVAGATAAGRSFFGDYFWRQYLLFWVGVFHGFFLWYGDILTLYAGVGCAAMCLLWMSPRAMLAVAAVIWSISFLLGGALSLGSEPEAMDDPSTPDVSARATRSGGTDLWSTLPEVIERNVGSYFARENELKIYREGHWLEMTLHRAIRVAMFWGACLFIGWPILAAFLLGIALFRLGWFADPALHAERWGRVLRIGLIVGLPLHLASAMAFRRGDDGAMSVLHQAGLPFMAAAYMAMIALWTARDAGGALGEAVSAVGRMALTNYLGQSVVCGFVFYGYGLGLMGQYGRAPLTLVLVPILWSAQLLGSVWWLRHFRTGPVEWLWRSAAAGRWLEFRRTFSDLPGSI